MPRKIEKEMKRQFKPNDFIFVGDMRDIFSPDVPLDYIYEIIYNVIERHPKTEFLFLTKNPKRYYDLLEEIEYCGQDLPRNVILGATIESNRDYPSISMSPQQSSRLYWMAQVRGLIDSWDENIRLFVSIEPILDFDLSAFVRYLRLIKPWMVAVGYDNYNNKLPEPALSKTMRLIEALEYFTKIERKTLRKAWYE